MKVFTFDTETNGLKSRINNVISIGATFWNSDQSYELGKGDFSRYLNWKLIKPNFFIPEETIKVHGINQEYLNEHGENPVKIYNDLYDELILFDVDVINGFNLPFDLNMFYGDLEELINLGLDKEGKLAKLYSLLTKDFIETEDRKNIYFIDSLIIDRIFRYTVNGLKVRHSLDSATKHYGILNEGAHDSLFDTHATVQLMIKQIEDLKNREVEVNQHLEDRIVSKYNLNQEYFKSRNGKAYDAYYIAKEA